MDNSNNPLNAIVEGLFGTLIAVLEVLIVGIMEAMIIATVGWIDALLGGGRK